MLRRSILAAAIAAFMPLTVLHLRINQLPELITLL